jgi:hypothetical protein
VHPLPSQERAAIQQRLRWLARVTDTQFQVPGLGWRFGWDAIIGLAPGIGDAVTTAISIYIILEAVRLGVSRWTLLRMIGNVAVDAAVGAVPLLGDLFDAAWKSNVRNLRLLGISPEDPASAGRKYVRNEAV